MRLAQDHSFYAQTFCLFLQKSVSRLYTDMYSKEDSMIASWRVAKSPFAAEVCLGAPALGFISPVRP
jgi:hypothetical protein